MKVFINDLLTHIISTSFYYKNQEIAPILFTLFIVNATIIMLVSGPVQNYIYYIVNREKTRNNNIKIRWFWNQTIFQNNEIKIELNTDVDGLHTSMFTASNLVQLNTAELKRASIVSMAAGFVVQTLAFQLLFSAMLLLTMPTYNKSVIYGFIIGLGCGAILYAKTIFMERNEETSNVYCFMHVNEYKSKLLEKSNK